MELKFDHSIVNEARFKGDACAISTAAASLLTELILGADIAELAGISDARLISALESDIQPARLQCVLLPLEALREGLRNYQRQDWSPAVVQIHHLFHLILTTDYADEIRICSV